MAAWGSPGEANRSIRCVVGARGLHLCSHSRMPRFQPERKKWRLDSRGCARQFGAINPSEGGVIPDSLDWYSSLLRSLLSARQSVNLLSSNCAPGGTVSRHGGRAFRQFGESDTPRYVLSWPGINACAERYWLYHRSPALRIDQLPLIYAMRPFTTSVIVSLFATLAFALTLPTRRATNIWQSPFSGSVVVPAANDVLVPGVNFTFEYDNSNWCESGFSPFTVYLTSGAAPPPFDNVTVNGTLAEGTYVLDMGKYVIANFPGVLRSCSYMSKRGALMIYTPFICRSALCGYAATLQHVRPGHDCGRGGQHNAGVPHGAPGVRRVPCAFFCSDSHAWLCTHMCIRHV